ncbi:MAG: lipoyl(octanoyl) transferase LipB [Aquificae bacterium]|nr:lipoyl(octanoyl) transferase LipB [Aquificota bacterium]
MKIVELGTTDYRQVLRLQKRFFQKKLDEPDCPDVVIITEHFPVYTAGKTTQREHLLNIPNDVPLLSVERGGSITFHGIGQLVVYPVFDLRKRKLSVKKFVWKLEQVIIDSLKELGVSSYRKEKHRGVFTDRGKIGFIGIKVSKMVSCHGFSLNVDVEREYFERILPCGLKDTPVCSLSDFLPDLSFRTVKDVVIKQFKKQFPE